MFEKILIANRGEIAARIIRTCRKLGVQTVAVYSEADKDGAFVRMADESYLLGPAKVSESYMNSTKILTIARESKVDAIHPGYGFLSENASFAKKCEQEGLTFIGPSWQAIESMGSKIKARKMMENAGIPVIPGSNTPLTTAEDAALAADRIGYPVMLKASAGGGGIGMAEVYNEQELKKVFSSNSKRASLLFGDGTMFIEKKIVNARHIEIQLLADSHGNAVHLFDRECSIQRRHQKIIEEAPSPFISESTRQRMGRAAVKAAETINYQNAGTIEFLVDHKENFYFLEMNTRLQVEHPVTEEITGIDIVEQQLKIANGERIEYDQESLFITGHSIEARIYAEDPVSFYPSPGQITRWELPEGIGIRHETAIEKNSKVTPFYDPMLAKLVVSGSSRSEAIQLLNDALEDYRVEGIKTNIPMLKKVINHEKFIEGTTLTSFIEDHYLPMLSK
ncbi:acetyl-CoA carboxylase biotin carboxylase subunit [Sediminibacillus albus]|uniref:biotin carboxylase n=1 Tax=Sediminibacillus albus TaxID=407036 RepID=A0A1G8VVW2_9BACI|nr:acetyl-CoA carboxylase biotin carboxylase subunit [Sediminibacillus albus]SDJ69993.1 acetyl-CoA carboxylase, biotin carboxylase subunit [Sediminibacillus albus]